MIRPADKQFNTLLWSPWEPAIYRASYSQSYTE